MLAEFVYCYLLRPWPLRLLKIWSIRKLFPKHVEFHGATVVLNPTDPVVSGALHLAWCGDPFFQSACRDGMTFLDVGANLGYYTALAARCRPLAVSSPWNPILTFGYLGQTIAANAVGNVEAFPVAASDARHVASVHLHRQPRRQSPLRLRRRSPASGGGRAASGCLVARKQNRHVDLIKIDVQGLNPRSLPVCVRPLPPHRISPCSPNFGRKASTRLVKMRMSF